MKKNRCKCGNDKDIKYIPAIREYLCKKHKKEFLESDKSYKGKYWDQMERVRLNKWH